MSEGQEPGHIAVLGQQLVDFAGQANRLVRQINPKQRRARAAGVPLVEDEIQNVQHRAQSLGALIGFRLVDGGRRAVIVSVIDNLLKGAASQAVQNFNRMVGFPETEGLS